MSVRTFTAFVLFALCSSAMANPKPNLGVQKFFGDWAVACDNRLECEAVSMQPEDLAFEGISLSLVRTSLQDEIGITLGGFDTKSDRYQILIDGRKAVTGQINTAAPVSIIINDKDAPRLARTLAKGSMLELRDGKGEVLGKISLKGSSAAFGYIDKVQNRATTKTALVNPGAKRLRVKSWPTPVIAAKRIVPTDTTPDATTLVGLIESSSCKDERTNVTEDTAYSLGNIDGKARALVMISCGTGAYNFASAAYIGTEDTKGKWQFAPAQFDYGDAVRTMDGSVQLLINADWNQATQTMSSYAKGRGLGDCGNAESYVWDGAQFRLISALAMQQCRGALDWLTIWQADVKLVD